MLAYLTENFATEFNEKLYKHLKVSQKTMLRKARELGLTKAENFREQKAGEIGERISRAHRRRGTPNPGCFKKGQRANPATEYKPGHKLTPEQMAKKVASQKKTWLNDCIRFTYGLKQETKIHFTHNALRNHLKRNREQQK